MMNEMSTTMQTLRFDDRDWLSEEYVRDDNGRLITREEYDDRVGLKEALFAHNSAGQTTAVRHLLQTALIGGMIWALTALISATI